MIAFHALPCGHVEVRVVIVAGNAAMAVEKGSGLRASPNIAFQIFDLLVDLLASQAPRNPVCGTQVSMVGNGQGPNVCA